jgi:hypothetical protein
VRAGDQARARADLLVQALEGRGAHLDAGAVAQRAQRAEQAGVLVGCGQHLVAWAKAEALQHAHHAAAR